VLADALSAAAGRNISVISMTTRTTKFVFRIFLSLLQGTIAFFATAVIGVADIAVNELDHGVSSLRFNF
jgi:hypothetical protein